MKYYGYVRVSTETQRIKNSVESQIHGIEKFCELCGISLEGIFEDLAISGTEPDRSGINKMIKNMDEEPCGVIVQSVDRLWRNEKSMIAIKKKLQDKDAEVISIMQPAYSIYSRKSIIDEYSSSVDYSSEESRKESNYRLSKGRKARAKNGNKPCGAAPYGYKWQENKIVIDFNNNLVVKDIFERYIELKSLAKLKEHCDAKCYKTSAGKDFSRQALKNIIENDFYIGVVTYAGKKTDGEHEPIITKSVFETANKTLKRHLQ